MKQIADFTILKKLRPDIYDFLNSNEPINKLFEINPTIDSSRVNLFKKLYLGIGNTNCYTVKLANNNILHIKMEYLNPMGNTHYSRYWIPYLYIAETLNLIKPGTKLLEVSSGNAGIALAMCASELDYNLTLILPEALPAGRIDPIKYYGANIILVNGYIKNCIYRLKRLIVADNYFATNHSEEKSDLLIKIMSRIAHEYYTDYSVPDYVISGVGNGTSTLALFNYFNKFKNQKIEFVGYLPSRNDENIVLGLYKYNTKLRHVNEALEFCDQIFYTDQLNIDSVINEFKFDTEIKNLGYSSLYGIASAMEISKKVNGKHFLVIGYDKKDRY